MVGKGRLSISPKPAEIDEIEKILTPSPFASQQPFSSSVSTTEGNCHQIPAPIAVQIYKYIYSSTNTKRRLISKGEI